MILIRLIPPNIFSPMIDCGRKTLELLSEVTRRDTADQQMVARLLRHFR